MAPKKKARNADVLQNEQLDALNNLLILLLLKLGTPQKEIVAALKVNQGNFSTRFPTRKFNKFDFLAQPKNARKRH